MSNFDTGPSHEEDFLLADAALANRDGAAGVLRERFNSALAAILISRGANPTEAEDVVADLWSDCFGARNGAEPLLRKYHGRSSLKSWLTTVATNRFIDLKRRGRFVSEPPIHEGDDEESAIEQMPSSGSQPSEKNLLEMARTAISEGFSVGGPEEMAMLKLVYMHELTQREIAQMWGCHESKVSRMLTNAMCAIQEAALSALKRMDPWLELQWNDLLEICESLPEVLGGPSSSPDL